MEYLLVVYIVCVHGNIGYEIYLVLWVRRLEYVYRLPFALFTVLVAVGSVNIIGRLKRIAR